MAEESPRSTSLSSPPRGTAFEGAIEMIVVPGVDGDIGVLARDAPLVATLKCGSTRIYVDRSLEEVREFATGRSFFKVELDRARALVDDAIKASEIDEARAQRQLEEAHVQLERVAAGESEADGWQLEQRIRDAENQLESAAAPPFRRRAQRVSCAPPG